MCGGRTIIKSPHQTKQQYTSPSSGVMYYKNNNSIGIRSKGDHKPPVISFGGKRCGLGEDELRAIADGCLEKLDDGHWEERHVQLWAQRQIEE